MIDPHFVILGACLGLVGSVSYAWQTVRGRTQPNRVTWFLWALAPLIAFFAQLDDGVGLSSIMTLSVGVGPALILAASFVNRSSVWQVGRFDVLCGLVSVAALVIWLTLDSPALAVVFAVLADFMGGLPTIVKAWRAPETESPAIFSLFGVNGAITLLTLDTWGPATSVFPAYITAIGFGIAAIVLVRTGSAGSTSAQVPASS